MQLGWTLPFGWAGLWTVITIPWVQSDLRREKKAWQEGSLHGGIPYTDDPSAPTPRTRFESVQEHLPHLFPWVREKPSPPSTPPDGLVEDGAASGARTETEPPPSVCEKESPPSTLPDGPAEDGPAPRARTEAGAEPSSSVLEKEPDGLVEDGAASGAKAEPQSRPSDAEKPSRTSTPANDPVEDGMASGPRTERLYPPTE